ncbi:MAG: hypothetical protein IPK52_27345 [Chloroflexi bacterium]|nr:hypothetical protein [Chloroflexota bacterium]
MQFKPSESAISSFDTIPGEQPSRRRIRPGETTVPATDEDRHASNHRNRQTGCTGDVIAGSDTDYHHPHTNTGDPAVSNANGVVLADTLPNFTSLQRGLYTGHLRAGWRDNGRLRYGTIAPGDEVW